MQLIYFVIYVNLRASRKQSQFAELNAFLTSRILMTLNFLEYILQRRHSMFDFAVPTTTRNASIVKLIYENRKGSVSSNKGANRMMGYWLADDLLLFGSKRNFWSFQRHAKISSKMHLL